MHVVLDAHMALLHNSVSRYVRNLVRGLLSVDGDLDLTLLVASRRPVEAVRADHPWIPERARVHAVRQNEDPYAASRADRLRRHVVLWPLALRRLGADVFHGQYNALPPFAPCPIVTTMHDVFEWVPGLRRGDGWRRAVRLSIERRRYRRASAIIASSQSTRRDFLAYVDPSHPHVEAVWLGVEETFSPEAAPGDEAQRRSLGLDDTPYVLYLGDVTPRKGVDTLLDAFAEVRGRLQPPHQLIVAGGTWGWTGGDGPRAHALAREGVARFLGLVPEESLPALYRGARAFVFPSLYEGFGFPPLEAMACGTPVISTRVSAIPEVVGDAGVLVPPRDAEALADAMLAVLSDEERRRQMRELGIRRASQFTWERTAERVREVYRRVCGER